MTLAANVHLAEGQLQCLISTLNKVVVVVVVVVVVIVVMVVAVVVVIAVVVPHGAAEIK